MDRILVVGPGAIGICVAAPLAHVHDVTIGTRTAAQARLIARRGIRLETLEGETIRASVSATSRPKAAGMDGVVLATKAAAAPMALPKDLDEQTPVLAVQNGMPGPTIKPLVPGAYVDVVVAFPADLMAPGQARRTGPGGFHIGPWPKAEAYDDPDVYRRAATWLSPAGPVQAHEDMRPVRWSKLLANACITSLGALTGLRLAELLDRRDARQVFLHVLREGALVARAEGVRPVSLDGFRPRLLAGLPGPLAHAAMRAAGRKYRGHRSSSAQSLARGQRTEVDVLNGRILEGAWRHGIQAPVNAAVVAAIGAIERGESRPDPAMLAKLLG